MTNSADLSYPSGCPNCLFTGPCNAACPAYRGSSKSIREQLGGYTIEPVAGRIVVSGVEDINNPPAHVYKCRCPCHWWNKYGGACVCECPVGVGTIPHRPNHPINSLKCSFGDAPQWPLAWLISGWSEPQTLSVRWS